MWQTKTRLKDVKIYARVILDKKIWKITWGKIGKKKLLKKINVEKNLVIKLRNNFENGKKNGKNDEKNLEKICENIRGKNQQKKGKI